MEKKFKCKDEVIFQNRLRFGVEKLIWNYGIVNYEDEGYVYLVGGLYINKKTFKILPYEGNEHLVGTTDEPDEEVKLEKGEWLMVETQNNNWVSAKYRRPSKLSWNNIDVEFFNGHVVSVNKIIRFSDFNPNDMEETKNHILCVKNGKVVKYKG